MRPPFSFCFWQKENGPRPVQEKKRFGGSVRTRADLQPPAKESWLSRAAVRDGNVLPLGGSFGPGKSRIPFLPLSAGATLPVCQALSATEQSVGEFSRTDLSSITPRSPPDPQSRRKTRAIEQSGASRQKATKSLLAHLQKSLVYKQTCTKVQVLRPASFSFGPGAARFLFGKIEKKMGGVLLPATWHSPTPERAHCRGQRRQKEQTYGLF